jgi:hypothetical protein
MHVNDDQFKRTMQSIGLSCFVKHFELFADRRTSQDQAVRQLMKLEGYAETGSRTRVSCSRRVIEAGRAKDGLRMFLSSKVNDYDLEQKARELLS